MSGPVTAPLTVSTIDGLTVGRPISVIKVSNGSLTISGNQATIVTGGGGGTGTVTSIATTAPITGGTITATGTIGITQSSGAADGYLSSTDWTTFNSKGSGTVTSVGSAQAFITITTATTTPSISIGDATGAATGVLTAADWTTFNNKQNTLSLTTTGTSGASTLVGSTLNVPQYSGGGGTITGSITDTQVAFGDTTANSIQGSANLTFDGTNLTCAGYVEVAVGSAAAPTYTFTTETDTGMYQDGTNSISWSGGGLKQMNLAPNGTLTLGTGSHTAILQSASTQDLKLQTNGGINSGSIVITDGVNGDISLTPDGTGAVEISGVYKLPTAVTGANDYILTAQTDGSTAWSAAAGGAGTITGSITDKKVAFGDTTPDSIQGSTSFTYNDTTKVLTIGAGTGTPTLQSGSADLVLRNSSTSAHSKITIGYDATDSDIILDTDGAGVVNIYSEGVKAYNLPKVVTTTNDYFLQAQTDGSTAWAEASGGGGGIVDILPKIGTLTSADQYNISTPPPWGGGQIVNQAISSMGLGARPYAFPFIAPETGTVSEVGVVVTTAESGVNLYVGIYDQDSNNLPSTRLGYATIDLSSTGTIYSSSITGTISLTVGQQFWFSINASANVFNGILDSVAAVTGTFSATPLGLTDDISDLNYSIKDTTSSVNQVPPSTFVKDDLDGLINRIVVGLKF